ncbi:hypothetical protein VCHA53O466_50055 [Vibrio chagasii]|nr:hypothetical protein VCHA53O466_50055 [Vibrio chagasii]
MNANNILNALTNTNSGKELLGKYFMLKDDDIHEVSSNIVFVKFSTQIHSLIGGSFDGVRVQRDNKSLFNIQLANFKTDEMEVTKQQGLNINELGSFFEKVTGINFCSLKSAKLN